MIVLWSIDFGSPAGLIRKLHNVKEPACTYCLDTKYSLVADISGAKALGSTSETHLNNVTSLLLVSLSGDVIQRLPLYGLLDLEEYVVESVTLPQEGIHLCYKVSSLRSPWYKGLATVYNTRRHTATTLDWRADIIRVTSCIYRLPLYIRHHQHPRPTQLGLDWLDNLLLCHRIQIQK